METQLDSFPLGQLPDRYGVARSNIYNRLSKLGIKPEKIADQPVLNADQLAEMDALDAHLKRGGKIATFGVSPSPTGQIEKSYRTQDTNGSAIAKSSPQMIALTSEQIIELVAAIASPASASPVDPFENLEKLDRISRSGWLLSSSQLAPLLERQSMPSKQFEMYGYRFTPEGKNGRERAWKIEKLH